MVHAKVLIGVATEEYSRRADFYDYFNMLDKNSVTTICLFVHERSPARARNVIAEQALKNDCTHVLFIDDDMAFRADYLNRLLKHDKDIVSGLYLTRVYPHQPLVFDMADDQGKCLFAYLDEDTPDLMPVVAAGFGFCLIKTDVFRKMEKPWVRLGELDPQEWSDDIGFFNRARAVGYQPYCDTTVQCGHIGTMIIWPNKVEGKWFAGYDTIGIGYEAESERQMVNVPQASPDVVWKK
jgi:hypothetical protein